MQKHHDDEYRKAFAADDEAVDEKQAAMDDLMADEVADNAPTDSAAEGAPEGEAPVAAVVLVEGEGEPPMDKAPADERVDPANANTEGDDVPPEDVQAYKSWQGRLKKREAELKAREQALAAKEAEGVAKFADGGNAGDEPSSTQSHIDHVSARYHSAMDAKRAGEDYDPQDIKNGAFLGLEDDADEPIVKRADGGVIEADAPVMEAAPLDAEPDDDTPADDEFSAEMQPEAAEPAANLIDTLKTDAAALAQDPERLQSVLAQMVEDYGHDYVTGLMAAVSPMVESLAGPYVERIDSQISALVEDVTSAFASTNREMIAMAHEDLDDIVGSEAFQGWLDGLPEEKKGGAMEVVERGSPRQIVKLLAEFKDSLKPKEASPEDVWAEDAAAGVKGSAPLRLPSRAPASDADEYKRAWEEM